MNNLLSKRAEVVVDWEDFLCKYLNICLSNPYDEKDNPDGYVNLGTALNNLCNDIIYPRITSEFVWHCDTTLLQYSTNYGTERLRKTFANVMTKYLESYNPISFDNLFCLAGVTDCIDVLAHCLADPGEVFLVPAPMYGRIVTNFKQRALVDVWPVHVITDKEDDFPVLTLQKIKDAYNRALAANRVVRGIFLINPNNPLGDIYSPHLLMDIMTFCKELSLHIILDELYALSVFSKTEKFHSVLKFPHLPDPERTHVLYGLSKDFGIAGLRVGIIHTMCKPLQKCLKELSFFQTTPYPVMEITARYLEDFGWCNYYISTLQQRLAEKYEHCVSFLEKMGLKTRQSSAGLFIWVDFRHLCGSSFTEEEKFFEYLIKEMHLFINPGKQFYCDCPGWFRIVFANNPGDVNEGLVRLEKAVKLYKPVQ